MWPRMKGLIAKVVPAVAVLTALTVAAADAGSAPQVSLSTTGSNSELVETVPLGRNAGSKPRVAYSLSPDRLGDLAAGDAVFASAEVEVSTTCLEPMRQCIGRIYHFSPHVRVRAVLGVKRGSHRGEAVTDWSRLQCSQALPHRNHHCVLVNQGELALNAAARCLPRCHLNLVVDAWHGSARKGHRLVIGTDQDNGSVSGDKGRLNALVFSPGPMMAGTSSSATKRKARSVTVGGGSVGPKQVIYSSKLTDLSAGEKVRVAASARVKTGHLPYGTLLQSQLVLSEKAGSHRHGGIPNQIAGDTAQITEQNGFNCTRGASAHRSPCVIKKAGVIRLAYDARTKPLRNKGPRVPLYVNLVLATKAVYGGEKWRSGDRARVRPGGKIRTWRY